MAFDLVTRVFLLLTAAVVVAAVTMAIYLASEPLQEDEYLRATQSVAGVAGAFTVLTTCLVVYDWLGR